jgi:hypothetical protein
MRKLNALRTYEMVHGLGSALRVMLTAVVDADMELTRAGLGRWPARSATRRYEAA